MALPKKKTPPKAGLESQKILIHGPPKIGKSSFCAQIDNAIFAATEQGLGSQNVYQVPIGSWQDFLDFCQSIATEEHTFSTVVIDTVNNLDLYVRQYVCAKHQIEHETDMGDTSKGYALCNREFARVMNKLAAVCEKRGMGLVMISHSKEQKIKDKRMGDRDMVVPSVPDSCRKFLIGFADLILFFDLEMVPGCDGKPEVQRVIRTKASLRYEAGDRTGRLPETLALDYAVFVEAFNTGIEQ